jgi:hypothetical protein
VVCTGLEPGPERLDQPRPVPPEEPHHAGPGRKGRRGTSEEGALLRRERDRQHVVRQAAPVRSLRLRARWGLGELVRVEQREVGPRAVGGGGDALVGEVAPADDHQIGVAGAQAPELRDVFRGTFTFTAANGDTLVIAQEGIIGDFDGYTLDAMWTVAGGSGRFAGATGSGTAGPTSRPAWSASAGSWTSRRTC